MCAIRIVGGHPTTPPPGPLLVLFATSYVRPPSQSRHARCCDRAIEVEGRAGSQRVIEGLNATSDLRHRRYTLPTRKKRGAESSSPSAASRLRHLPTFLACFFPRHRPLARDHVWAAPAALHEPSPCREGVAPDKTSEPCLHLHPLTVVRVCLHNERQPWHLHQHHPATRRPRSSSSTHHNRSPDQQAEKSSPGHRMRSARAVEGTSRRRSEARMPWKRMATRMTRMRMEKL